MSKLLFSVEGRINRAKFWAVLVPVIALVFVLRLLFEMTRSLPVEDRAWPLFVLCVPTFLLVWIGWAVQCKRWQDQGKSATPWRLLLNFVPVIGTVWILVECGMLRGTVGPNKYGPDPLEPNHPPETVSSGASVPSTVRGAAETRSNQNEVGEKYAMLLKYSDKAREAEARLSKLPDEFQERFKQEAVANPGRVEEIAVRLFAENQKRLVPFGDSQLDALYQKLDAYGAEAQAEFQRVLTFLKGQVDPEKVFIQIVVESERFGDELKKVRESSGGGTIRFVWNGEIYTTREELHADILRRLLSNAGSMVDTSATAPNPDTKWVPFEFRPAATTQARSSSSSSSLSGLQARMAEIARQTEEIRRGIGHRSDSGRSQ